jgi:regulator of protease activity HflC (stomatin/prohibitin superfamily)
MIREKPASVMNGGVMLVLLFVVLAFDVWVFRAGILASDPAMLIGGLLLLAATILAFSGLFVVSPGEARVLQLMGSYVGSVKNEGLWWTNPFTAPRRRVSLRVRNFESAKLKVNDHDGNPIEIAAVVVWRVVDTAEAMFEVDNYENFVKVQTEAAVRNLASTHPYDAHNDGQMSLRANIQDVADQLKKEVQERLTKAGVEVIEARISHLAYAPEIASAMLQRQQASAIVAARTKIVEGAVGIVEMALAALAERGVVEFDTERRAAMVSNLLVVLCSDHDATPVINTGTLYT